ncbi:MAG: hypothetical protein RSF00_07235, partial [Oscillospiraceae bacterium]
ILCVGSLPRKQRHLSGYHFGDERVTLRRNSLLLRRAQYHIISPADWQIREKQQAEFAKCNYIAKAPRANLVARGAITYTVYSPLKRKP